MGPAESQNITMRPTTLQLDASQADLLSQIEKAVDNPGRVKQAAMNADAFISNMLKGSVHTQEEVASRLTIPTLLHFDLLVDAQLASALMAAAYLESKRLDKSRMTVSDRFAIVLENLSEQYQSDW